MTPESGSIDRSGAASGPERAPFNSTTVARQFDRRAARFAGAAAVVREIGARLCERLNEVPHEAALVLDLGCGAGALRAVLLKRFARATWLAVALSRAILAQARSDVRAPLRWLPAALRPRARSRRICADAARLPLASAWADCLVSNRVLECV